MLPTRSSKILVAMSGGVDSSVVACMLKEAGHEVVGCFMRLGSEDSVEEGYTCDPTKVREGKQGCCSVNDADDARLVAAMLEIPFYVLNFRADFGRIINYFVDEYNAGRTPNPCVRCNDWLKFGKLLNYAQTIDADFVATGHYARVDHASPTPRLLRGVDQSKDQSYVLFGSKIDRLRKMLLPIGEMVKPDVRAYAQAHKLPVFNKPDSQEICFVPDNDYARLVTEKSPNAVHVGKILDRDGKQVGEHPGHQHFTIGQRRKVGVALGYPIYVTHRDPVANTITVGLKDDLMSIGLKASQTNWLIDPPQQPIRCEAKIRYNSPPEPATVQVTGDGQLAITFDKPVEAVTCGQAVVCYLGDQCIGGGWIDEAISS
ncbi:MAG: tRNA 2-thiouridine(34) synthase MnmA [Phycisphaeraceae bacterium]|nr:tRNA 2-thiouridine(34) synthase MnmA [Phycisphaeraceae bacterium]